VVVDASPSIELAADALFGGPDPLRRLQDLYAEGLRLHRAGQVAKAAARYEAALALAPASGRAFASVHLNLGSARMALGDAAAALAAFREARRVQPASAKAAFNEALALLRLGRTREGSRVVSGSLQLALGLPWRTGGLTNVVVVVISCVRW
jgi:tetratricopeptide (TPR) repeat protein